MPKPASVHNKLPVKESAKWLTFEYIMQKYHCDDGPGGGIFRRTIKFRPD